MKFITLLCFIIALMHSTSFAQKMSLFLSNHTFSVDKPEIGNLNTNSGDPVSFKLRGKNSKMFIIEGSRLSIRPQYIKIGVRSYDMEVQVKSAYGTARKAFRIVNDQFIRNKVIAHRGAWKNTGVAENSILALEHAIRLGCQGSEFDVHMTEDSVLVINHDPTIQGKTIATSSSSELAQLKLSSGEFMPTLEAFLKAGLKQNNTKLILEIKPATGKERALQMSKKVVELVQKLKAEAWVDYISFDYNICLEVQRLDPYARVAYLNGDKSPEVLVADKLWGFDYHFNVFKKNEGWIEDARQKGLTINAWTVNDPELLQWFLDRKIDFITTNEPELLLKMVKRQ